MPPVANPAIQQLGVLLKELHQNLNEIDEKSTRRDALKDQILQLIKAHGLEDKRFDVGNRMVRYKVLNNAGPITNKYLITALENYYKEDRARASQVYQYIVENKPKIEKETLDISKKKPAE